MLEVPKLDGPPSSPDMYRFPEPSIPTSSPVSVFSEPNRTPKSPFRLLSNETMKAFLRPIAHQGARKWWWA